MKSITTYSLDVKILKKFNSKIPKQERTKTIEGLILEFLNNDAARVCTSDSVDHQRALLARRGSNEK